MHKNEMYQNPVKKALRERNLCLGAWIQIGHPAIAEIFATAGFEWIAADIEHTDIDVEGFTGIARGMHGRGAVPMARVRENDPLAIRQVLDGGAMGVIVPLVNNAEEALKAVRAAKFPPAGIRGFAFCRGNDWGYGFDAYAKKANDQIAVVVMIESREAVENIDSILQVDGVDGVFVGPYDMTGSYGVIGQTSHEVIREALGRVLAACGKHGKSAGIHVVRPDKGAVEEAIRRGFTFIALGMDTVFLAEASKETLAAAGRVREGRV